MYLNVLSATVYGAASPPSGNQLFSSSLSPILSLEQPRLKTPCLFASLSSRMDPPSLTRL
jgi:hypothetical protein